MRSWRGLGGVADGDVRPRLPVEYHGRHERLHPGLYGVQLVVEIEKHHRRLAERQLVGLRVERDTLRLVLLAARGGHERIELRILEERHVATHALVRAVEQGI